MPPPPSPQKRAAPLPPAARRAAIIQAVLPLLVEHGEQATSRQLADAAGVAEGTIFSVFEDKDALFAAVLDQALDPAPLSAAIGGIDGELPLETQLEQAVDLIQRRIVDVWQLLSKLHRHRRQTVRPTPLGDSPALTALFAAARGRLRVEPAEAAALLRALTLALSHPMFVAEARPPGRHRRPVPARRGRGPHEPVHDCCEATSRPTPRMLWLIMLLQAVQTAAALALPALSADLINQGVLLGDTGAIWRIGGWMLAFSLIQIVFAATAVHRGADVATAFGRDVRRDLFHRVTEYSSREVGAIGAPSLITRITNDVQQVQQVVIIAATMMVAAPITMVMGLVLALREDVGLSVVLAVAVPVTVVVLGSVIVRMIPAFRRMQGQVDRVNAVLREQLLGNPGGPRVRPRTAGDGALRARPTAS